MLCLEDDVEKMSLDSISKPPLDSTDSSVDEELPVGPILQVEHDPRNTVTNEMGWIDGLLGCLRPVWTIIGKVTTNEMKATLQGTVLHLLLWIRLVQDEYHLHFTI